MYICAEKEFCILNKQYDEKTFRELREKIVAHMKQQPYVDKKGRAYQYGELFPVEISPHSYNETLAQEYVPLSEEKALELGMPWYVAEDKSYDVSKKPGDLPDTITDVTDTILSDVILCEAWEGDRKSAQEHKCSKAFKITPNELAMYRKWNIPLPRKCPNTRNFELSKIRNSVNFFHKECACNGARSRSGGYKNTAAHYHGTNSCPNEFETSYSPERPEIVYCEQCYQAEVV